MNLGYSPSVIIRKRTNKDQNIRIHPHLRVALSSHTQSVSETVARLFQSKGICTHYKPINSIRQQLVAPKDTTKMEHKSGTIHHIMCDDPLLMSLNLKELSKSTLLSTGDMTSSPATYREY